MHHQKTIRFFALFFTVFYCLLGCSNTQAARSTEILENTDSIPPSLRQLTITVTQAPSVQTFIPVEENGTGFTNDIACMNVDNVQIIIDDTTLALEDALNGGHISAEEIFCFARMDAGNGICQETWESKNGLSNFTFLYPDYCLRLIYDIYETPDGKQHLISDMCIYSTNSSNETISYYVDPTTTFFDQETGYLLDREDWGLAFEITDCSPTGLTLTCTQSSGQQIGQLSIQAYTLYKETGYLERIDNTSGMPVLNSNIEMNGSSTITIDWTNIYGELGSGEYDLTLLIRDNFNKNMVHPLIVDYHDLQMYDLPLTIS